MKHRRVFLGGFPSDTNENKNVSMKKIRKEVGTDIFKARQNTRSLLYNTSIKAEVLSHYGPDGALQCSMVGCSIVDPDMLSLDHVNNDGAEDRGTGRGYAGVPLYAVLKTEGYPEGFATLCCNHQNKKELALRREKATNDIALVKSSVELAVMACGLYLPQEAQCKTQN
jgi:hypothetical protein